MVASIVSAVTSLLLHQRSKSRWHQISLLISPTAPLSPSQFSLITLSLRSSPHLALHFFNLTLHRPLCRHSIFSYAAVIHTLARSRTLHPQTLTVIQSALINFPNQTLDLFRTLALTYRKFDSAPFVFDLLIEAVLRSKRLDLAVEITRLLLSRGIFPTIRTCNELIRCVFKRNGVLVGYNLYKEVFDGSDVRKNATNTIPTCQNKHSGLNSLTLPHKHGRADSDARSCVSRIAGKVSPNVCTYNVILLAFYREGMVRSLEGVWGKMVKHGILLNAYSYGVLMRAYCEDARMGEAERVWKEMGEKGLKRDEVSYEIMIEGYCNIGDVGRAEEFFREMEMSGIESSYASFEHLIKGYCEVGDFGSALLLYKDMCRRGFKPEGSVVDIVVQRFCRVNKVFEGLEFLRVALRKYEIVPRWKSYQDLMKGLCDEGLMEEALKLQGELAGKGFEPNSEMYKFFIEGYRKQGKDEMVTRLKKEMIDTQIIEEDD